MLDVMNQLRVTMNMPATTPEEREPLLTFLLNRIRSNRENYAGAFSFLLDFLQVPPDAYHFNYLRTASAILTKQLLSGEAPQLYPFMRLAHDLLFEEMVRYPSPNTNPDNETAYPIYFLLLKLSPNPALTFSSYGLTCVRMLFAADTPETRAARRTPRTIPYDLGLGLRTFLDNAGPVNSDRRPLDPLPLRAICEAFERAPSTTSLNPDTITTKLACVLAAAGHEQRLRGPQPGLLRPRRSDIEGQYVQFASVVEALDLDDEDSAFLRSVDIETSYPRVLAEALHEAECRGDYATERVVLPQALARSPLRKVMFRRVLALGTIAAKRKPHHWQRSTLSLLPLAKLKYALSGRPGERDASLLIAGTGQSPDAVISMVWLSRLDDHPRSLALDPRLRALVYNRPAHWLGWEDVPDLPGCLPTSERIIIPLPPEVWEAISPFISARQQWEGQLPEDHRMFVFATPSRGLLDIAALNAYLKGIDHRLTAAKLSTAFRRITEGRLNLDPLTLAYISRTIPVGFSSQMFYRRLSLSRLTFDYFTATDLLHQLLHREYMAMTTGAYCYDPVPPKAFRPSIPEWVAHTPLAYGSKVVPRKKIMRRFFRAFRRTLRQKARAHDTAGRRLYFNLLMTYLYLGTLFATGIRPFRDGIPSQFACFVKDQATFVLVGEKDNGRFRDDYRIIPLCPLAQELCHEALAAASDHVAALDAGRWGTYRPIYHQLAEANFPLFFLLDQDDRPSTLTPKAIRSLLASVGLDELYQMPMNAGRHLHMTHTFEMRIHHTLADRFYGHQREGHEFLARTATTDTAQADSLLNKAIMKLMRQIDLLPTRFRKLD